MLLIPLIRSCFFKPPYPLGLKRNVHLHILPAMMLFDAVTIHPEIQDGAPVFSGTRIRVETFFDYLRLGISVHEFLADFPSITYDQAMQVYSVSDDRYCVQGLLHQMGLLHNELYTLQETPVAAA